MKTNSFFFANNYYSNKNAWNFSAFLLLQYFNIFKNQIILFRINSNNYALKFSCIFNTVILKIFRIMKKSSFSYLLRYWVNLNTVSSYDIVYIHINIIPTKFGDIWFGSGWAMIFWNIMILSFLQNSRSCDCLDEFSSGLKFVPWSHTSMEASIGSIGHNSVYWVFQVTIYICKF